MTFVLIGLFVLVLIFIKLFHHKGIGGSSVAVLGLSKSLRYNPSRSLSPSPPLPFLLRHGQSQGQRGCSGHQGGTAGADHCHDPISQLNWSRAVSGGQGGGLGPAGSGLRSSIASSTSASSTRYSQSVDGERQGVSGRPYRVYYGDGTEEWRRTNRTLESHWKF